MKKKEKNVLKRCFKIFSISKEGHLSLLRDDYDRDDIFYQKYDTREEALEDIRSKLDAGYIWFDNITIVEVFNVETVS